MSYFSYWGRNEEIVTVYQGTLQPGPATWAKAMEGPAMKAYWLRFQQQLVLLIVLDHVGK